MKILNYFIIAVSIVFACLFYNQSSGLNVLLFAGLLITGLFCVRKAGSDHPFYIYILFAISALAVFVYGNTLALVSCQMMFLVIAGKLVFAKQPMAFSILPGFVNSISAFPVNLHHTLSRKTGSGTDHSPGETVLFKLLRTLTIGLVLFVFFVLYLNSSAGFSKLVNSSEIEFPTFNFWFMLLIGAFVSHAIFHHATRSLLKSTVPQKPEHISDTIVIEDASSKSWLSAGTALFAALNILSGVVLASDLYFILSGTLGQHNPSFYSEIVHEGVWSLIFSIALAMSLLFIFFEGRINFLQGNKIAKRCAFLWIIFNLLLVLVTAYKNGLYIAELGMTYKRIGVWYYLAASVVGLSVMYIKIRYNMNFLYLVRKTIPVYIVLMVLSSLVPWEIAVTEFNIAQAIKKGKRPDIDYLVNLDGNNLHLLRSYTQQYMSSPLYESDRIELEGYITYYRERISQKDFRSMVLMEQVSFNQLK